MPIAQTPIAATSIPLGSTPRARVVSTSVPLNAGLLATVSTFGLLAPVTFSRDAGSNANLSLNLSTGAISAASALGAGVTQQISGVATGADKCAIAWTYNLTGQVSVPAAPTVTLTAGNGQVSIAYSPNATGGAAITAYRLYAGASVDALELMGTIPVASASPYVDTGLTNGMARFYAMSAVNSAGEGPLSAAQSATPSASVAAPTATATMTQISANDAKRVYQRTTTTGGSQGKGTGVIPLTISGATAGTINARVRDADGVTILEPEFVVGTITNGQTTLNVTVPARLGWFYVDVRDAVTGWQNGTTLVGMGRLIALSGQSLAVRAYNKTGASGTFASNGLTPPANGSCLGGYGGGSPVYNPTVSTMPWQQFADGGTYDAPFGSELLRAQIATSGVNCGLIGYAVGSTPISSWANGQANNTYLKSVLARAGGAFEAFVWFQGHSDSGIGTTKAAYKTALATLMADIASVNSFAGFSKYVASIPYLATTGWGKYSAISAIRRAAGEWCSENSATYVNVDDLSTTDGVHQDFAGGVTCARHFHRAMQGQDSGFRVTSASRVGAVITCTVAHGSGGSDFSAVGSLVNRVRVFDSGSITALRRVTSFAKVDSTSFTLTLDQDPGDGAALDLWFFPATANAVSNNGNTDYLADNLVAGDGFTTGRILEATITAPINVPLVSGSTINKRRYPATGASSPSYTASSGWGSELTGGWASSLVPLGTANTIECRTNFASAPASTQVFMGFSMTGGLWVGVNSSGNLVWNNGSGIRNTTTSIVGTKKHIALVINGTTGTIYVDGVQADTASCNSFDGALLMGIRSLMGAFTVSPGGVDEVALWETARYTSGFTAPTNPYVGNETGLVSLFHLDGNLIDSATT